MFGALPLVPPQGSKGQLRPPPSFYREGRILERTATKPNNPTKNILKKTNREASPQQPRPPQPRGVTFCDTSANAYRKVCRQSWRT